MDSMTGYGSHSLEFRDAVISAQARSVNHKGLQIVCRLPHFLSGIEEGVRTLVRSGFTRGRVEVSLTVSMSDSSPGGFVLDTDAARSCLDAVSTLTSEFGLGGEMDAASLLRMPGVMVQHSPEDLDREGLETAALECAGAALGALAESRRQEGDGLSAIFLEKLAALSVSLGPIMDGQESRVRERYAKLRERVGIILGDTRMDEDRLMSELALMADRVDVSEEFERLEAHIGAATDLLEGESTGCGRKLGFIFQEMLRELNTMCAKVDDAAAQNTIISMKDVLGGMREQVANVE
jgi:uncharacterized protein (TIGR00255 family)